MNSSYVFCDRRKNCAQVHLSFCQHNCKHYPCKQAEDAEVNLAVVDLPHKFNKKGDPINGTTSKWMWKVRKESGRYRF